MASSDTPKTLKAHLNKANEEPLYCLFLLSFFPILAEIAGHASYNFVVVDMEHGHGGISKALPCLQALAATQTPVILRLPESFVAWAKKALDLGPQGIMFPVIDDPKLAKKAVSYCRYPPNGVCGAAHPVVRASKYGIDDVKYISSNAMCYAMLYMLEWMRKEKHRIGIMRTRGLRGSALSAYINGGIP